MKILNKKFVFPILIHRTNSIYTDRPDILIRWDKQKMGGTMKTTSYTFQIATKKQ